MTDRKISDLVAVTSVDDADEFVLARSGSSNKITGANMGASFGGGGSVVSCLLARDAAIDIRSIGGPILWDALYDNVWDSTPLAAIPAGLGLAFVFDGSSAVITTTEAGTWAFSLQLGRNADATWQGDYSPGLGRGTGWPSSVTSGTESLVTTDVLTLPGGVALTPTIDVSTAATANPYTASAYLSIVRLG